MIVLSMIDHLWGHILQSSTESIALTFVHLSVTILLEITLTSPAEVANFEHVIAVDEQIFWL